MILSHATGNANVRNAVIGILDAGLLEEFVTTVAVFPGTWADWLSCLPGLGELRRRSYSSALQQHTRCHPWRELLRSIAPKLKLGRLLQHETGFACIDQVYHSLDRHVAKRLKHSTADAVYAYEDGALASFRASKALRKTNLYDLPIGYWRAGHRIFREEAERAPEWASTLTGLRDSPAKLARKDEEIALANQIYVATSFTRQTLSEYPGPLPPVTVVPYGFPPVVRPAPEWRPDGIAGRPLRVLFAGGLSQRKGLSDLFRACELAGSQVELTVIGRHAAECPILDQHLARCRWIPSLPHAEVLAEMECHDVFIFPSLFEGFGLVLTEAMSRGMAVITTPNTAGPNILTHGHDGFLVPIRAPEAIAELLSTIHTNRDQLASIRLAARETAAKRPWSAYGRELAALVRAALRG